MEKLVALDNELFAFLRDGLEKFSRLKYIIYISTGHIYVYIYNTAIYIKIAVVLVYMYTRIQKWLLLAAAAARIRVYCIPMPRVGVLAFPKRGTYD